MTHPISFAAAGDLASTRELADEAYRRRLDNNPMIAAMAWTEAITFARLAAARGQSEDQTSLVYLLSSFASWLGAQGQVALATTFEGQALALAEVMAESGCDEMADMIAGSGHRLPAAVFEEARRFRDAVDRSNNQLDLTE